MRRVGSSLSTYNLQAAFIMLAGTGCQGGREIQCSEVSINPADVWGLRLLKEWETFSASAPFPTASQSLPRALATLLGEVSSVALGRPLPVSVHTRVPTSSLPWHRLSPQLLLLSFAGEEFCSILHTQHTQYHTR